MSKLTLKSFPSVDSVNSRIADNWIKVGMSTCGIAAGADETFDVFKKGIKDNNCTIQVKKCGCAGMCFAEPLVEVKVEGMPSVIYGNVKKDVAFRIIQKHILGKQLLNDYVYCVKDQ